MNKRLIFDTTLGIHYEYNDVLASDGTGPESNRGLAATPLVQWTQNDTDYAEDDNQPEYHSIAELEQLSAANRDLCAAPTMGGTPRCPVSQYYSGGPGFLNTQQYTRYQASEVATYIFQGLGHHVVKFGLDLSYDKYRSAKAYTGGQNYDEVGDGSSFQVDWTSSYGVITGPDNPEYFNPRITTPHSVTWGAFIQDSWSVMDVVTLNLGVRYDEQYLFNSAGDLGLAMPNQWSPRLGAIYDILQDGTTKLFANYARYYQSLPLDLADVTLSGEPHIRHAVSAESCDGLAEGDRTGCNDADIHPDGGPWDPNRRYQANGAGASPVDPDIKPPSTDEIVVGGEYEVIDDLRLGMTYTKRWLNYAVEDMSADYATTYFLGNPGYGIGNGFPKASRDYDAFTVFLTKAFSDTWLAQASYTLAWLRGNYPGLFRPESGDLLPGHGTDFDHYDIVVNRDGPLPGDRRHDIKVFGAKDWNIGQHNTISNGLSFRANSGGPTNYLGGDTIYYGDENYLLQRGSGKRLPWEYGADVQLGYRFNFTKDVSIGATLDVFNVFNFQNVVGTDQVYTWSPVAADENRKKSDLANLIDNDTGAEAGINPNFGKPTAYQAPRIFRFGVRGTF